LASASARLEQEPNNEPSEPQKISVPCEVQGQFYPQDDVDCYEFSAKKGDVFWIEVFSERLGQPTDPFVLVQKVTKNKKGASSVSDVQEMYDSDANIGGAVFRTSSRDPSWRLEATEESTYRLQVRDLFNKHADPSRVYRLSIRREAADFRLVALVMPPPTFENDKREAHVWSAFLRRNDTLLMKVLALRRDNFSGPIELQVTGLPDGARASESLIAEGQNAAWLSITTSDKIADWHGPIQIVGKSKEGKIVRAARGATVEWNVPDYNNEAIQSRLMQELMLATSLDQSPFRIEPEQPGFQTASDSAVSISLRIARSDEFKKSVKFRAYVDAQDNPIKEWEADGPAVETKLELNAKQAKLGVGPHQLHVFAQTSGRIRKVRPEEISSLEAELKKAADERKKQIEERLKLHDVSAIFCSPVFGLNVTPPAAK
jgi:hypothetical protein